MTHSRHSTAGPAGANSASTPRFSRRPQSSQDAAALGRADDASREAAAAHETFERLGAEAAGRRVNTFLEELATAKPELSRPEGQPLTGREIEVLRLVAEGMSDAEIAERLVLSEHTVHRHVANIRISLAVSSRSAAVAQAAKLGLLWRSAHTWFVLHELLSYERVRNYDGSWTEYGSLVHVPVDR